MEESAATAPRSALSIIFVTVFVDLLGFGIVLPLLPYYAQTFHASAFVAGAVVASYSAMQLLFAPLWGRASDRIGRRPVILVSLAASTLSYGLFAAANGLGLLFASRLLAGAGGANVPVAQAFIADITSERDRAKGMGLIGAAFGIGFVFGPAIGGMLATYGHWAPGLAAALICGSNFVVAAIRLPESLAPARRQTGRLTHPLAQWRQAVRRPQLGLLLALFFMALFSFATMETTLSLLCAHAFVLTPTQIYWLFGFMGLVTSVVQGGLIGRLTHHFSEHRLMAVGCVLLGLGLLVTPFTRPFSELLVALGLIASGQGMASPTLSSLISQATEATEQGGVLGLSQSVGSLARIIGPLWGGLLFDGAGPAGPYVATGLLMVLASGFALRVTAPRAAGVAATAQVRASG
jgi:multidrug resistance protein